MTEFLLKPEEIKQLTDIRGGCLASNKITVDGEKVYTDLSLRAIRTAK